MRSLSICLLLLQVLHDYHSSPLTFFDEDEVNHLRPVRDNPTNQTNPCDEDALMDFLAEIQETCDKVAQNLVKTKDYLKTCQPPNQPDLYLELIKGVESLHAKLCSDSSFKTRFQNIHKCIHELRNDFEDCGGPADWNENSEKTAVCKAYKDVTDCYYIKTAKVCGKQAAATMKELLLAIINSIITVDCPNVKSNPAVSDAMPDDYIKKNKGEFIKASSAMTMSIIVIYTIL